MGGFFDLTFYYFYLTFYCGGYVIHCKHFFTLSVSFFIAPWPCFTANPPTHTRTVSSVGVFRVRLSWVPGFPNWQPPQGPGPSESKWMCTFRCHMGTSA